MSTIRVRALMNEGDDIKKTADGIVEKFVGERRNSLVSIHPALQSSQTFPASTSLDRVSHTTSVVASNDASSGHETLVKRCGGSDAHEEEDIFKRSMRDYEATAKEKYRTGVDPDSEHNIEQISLIIENAISIYEDKDAKGAWVRIRRAFRKFGDNSAAFKGWLGLLPTESHYMSVVCGGLKLIVMAASRMRHVAQTVLDGLHRIPSILIGAQRVMKIFPDDKDLQAQCDVLYTTVLEALGCMLHYLKEKSAKKLRGALFKQDAFEQDLELKITKIETERDTFNERALYCHMETMEKHRRTMESRMEPTGAPGPMEKRQSFNEKNAEEQQQQTKDIQERVDAYLDESKRVTKAVEELTVVTTTGFESIVEVLKQGEELLRKAVETYKANTQIDSPDGSPSSGESSSYQQRRKQLLSQLDYHPRVASRDVVNNYKHGGVLSGDDQARSLFVIRSQALADWVVAEESDALIINGKKSAPGRMTPLSFVCARLVYAIDKVRLLGRPDIITTHFFCGQHDTYEKSWECPSGVVNSLLAQLLTQCRNMNDIKIEPSQGLKSHKIKKVFGYFENIIRQLPKGVTIFCVIDAISVYANLEETEEDAEWLVLKLLRLATRKPPKNATFKLLLTAPNTLRLPGSDSELEDIETLNVIERPPKNGGVNDVRWGAAIGDKLERALKK